MLHESSQIVMWDVSFVGAKLYRALDGRYRRRRGTSPTTTRCTTTGMDRAKIALLCLQRSRIAWQTLADAWGNADASAIAASITEMISSIERHFPDAASFVQPGLDHPHI